ncbi:MAG: ketopantoate reductase family protein [Gemmatimonadaceae bacterium]
MKVLVLGAGAIGGYFGGRMAAAGVDVTFLVRPGRHAQLERDGIVIESPMGDLKMPVKTVEAAALKPEYDLVLLTCKSYDLVSAMDAIAPAMQGKCAVVPMLNGMSHFAVLDERFGRDNVFGGLCAIMCTMKKDGAIVQLGPLHRIVIGARTGGDAIARCEAFAEALVKSKVEVENSTRIDQDLWEKVVFLSAAAGLTCLFRANIAEIMAAEGGPEAVDLFLNTNMEISAHEGFPLRPAAVEFCNLRLKTPSALTASMLRDLESGNAVESDHIVGFMLNLARKHGLDDTIHSIAFTHLKAYENRRAAGRVVAIG